MGKSSQSVARKLYSLSKQWFNPESPEAALLVQAVQDIEQYKASLKMYKDRCSRLQSVIIKIDEQLSSCQDIR